MGSVLWRATKAWFDENCLSHAAGIAFYTILSLSPFLVLALALSSLMVDSDLAIAQVRTQLAGIVGSEGADLVATMVKSAHEAEHSGLAALIAIGTTLVAATAAVAELQSALDALLGGAPRKTPITVLIRVRLVAIAMALGFGFLIVVSLILSAIVAALITWSGLTSGSAETLAVLGNEVVSALLVSVAFFGLLRFLPRSPLPVKETLRAAATAGLLFEVAKFGIGWYLKDADAIKGYGSAGSVVALMLWVYYVSGIFLFGALVGREYGARRANGFRAPARRAPLPS